MNSTFFVLMGGDRLVNVGSIDAISSARINLAQS
jgi:hypothetical protein